MKIKVATGLVLIAGGVMSLFVGSDAAAADDQQKSAGGKIHRFVQAPFARQIAHSSYFKSRWRVYYNYMDYSYQVPSLTYILIPIAGADSRTFDIVCPENGALAKDKSHVYFLREIVADCDSATCHCLPGYQSGRIWVDVRHVWYDGQPVPGANGKSFHQLPKQKKHEDNIYYYADANHVYRSLAGRMEIVKDADPATFHTLEKDV